MKKTPTGPRKIFSAEEDAKIIRCKTLRLTFAEIEKRMTGRTVRSIQSRYALISQNGTADLIRLSLQEGGGTHSE